MSKTIFEKIANNALVILLVDICSLIGVFISLATGNQWCIFVFFNIFICAIVYNFSLPFIQSFCS